SSGSANASQVSAPGALWLSIGLALSVSALRCDVGASMAVPLSPLTVAVSRISRGVAAASGEATGSTLVAAGGLPEPLARMNARGRARVHEHTQTEPS